MSTGRMLRRSLLKDGRRLGMLAAVESILPAYIWSSEANAVAQIPQVSGNVIDLITSTVKKSGDFTGTIEHLPESRFRVVYLLSKGQPNWEGERGHVTLELLQRFGALLPDNRYYICGPPAMTGHAVTLLTISGVTSGRIHTEVFAL